MRPLPRGAARRARLGAGSRRGRGRRGCRLGPDLPAAGMAVRAAPARPGPVRCLPPARRVRRRSNGRAVRHRPYASLSMRTRRSTRLGFQPPAIGDEEIAAVAETLRSGWLTTGPRAALLEDRAATYL